MEKGRLEAYSDAVIAIAMTIMVLDLRPPHSSTLWALRDVAPDFLSYVLSFAFLGIYWNNHHHLMHASKNMSGQVLWPNLHLLFWLSLIPFATAWMGGQGFTQWPVVLYGTILLMCGAAYSILTRALVAANGKDSAFAKALGGDFKGNISVVAYLAAIGLAFVAPIGSCILYVAVACLWFVPDRRFERSRPAG